MGSSATRDLDEARTRRIVEADDAAPTPSSSVGSTIGRYVVLERIGEGGMGVVLRAYDPKLRREVALKRLRHGAIDAKAEARLVREAQAMARLSHPNVVAVYDVEPDTDGVFVAMELVSGTTLREHLAAQTRPWRELVHTFIAAGRGLAAAHRMGLVHRDFKPANVLVASDGRIKVGDFGLARALTDVRSQESASPTTARDDGDGRLTQAGVVHGTPRYMAPEQFRDEDVGVHTDQYAFCVALWEALCGAPPFVGDTQSMQMAKREGPPSWPRPRAVPPAIGAALRRGLASDPKARWPDMDPLLAALARDPGARRRIVAAVAVGAAGVAGVVALRWADERRELAACASSAVLPEWDERIAEATTDSLARHGPGALDTWTRVRPALDRWAASWQQLREDTCAAPVRDPASVRATAESTMACLDEQRDRLAAVVEALGHDDRAVASAALTSAASLVPVSECSDERVLLHRVPLPTDPEEREAIAAIRRGLAGVEVEVASGRYTDAMEHADALRVDAEAIGWAPLLAEIDLRRSDVHERLGDPAAARDVATEAFFAAGAAGHDALALRAAIQLVDAREATASAHAESLRWAELARMLVQRLGLEGRRLDAELAGALGELHRWRAAYPEARAAAERALAIDEALFGSEHLVTVRDVIALGVIELDAGSVEAAHAAFARGCEITEAVHGPRHPVYAHNLGLLVAATFARGEYREALALNERVLEIQRTALGPDHFDVARAHERRGTMLQQIGEYDEALAAYARAEAIIRDTRGADSLEMARIYNNVAIIHTSTGHPDAAIAKLQRVLEIREHALAPDHPDIARGVHSLGVAYGESGDCARATPAFERAVAIRERALGPDHPDVAISLQGISRCHLLEGHPELGLPFAERALAITRKQLGDDHTDLASLLISLANLQFATGDLLGATKSAEEALAIRERGDVTPYLRAEAKWMLGRALSERRVEHRRARELLTAARDELRALALPQHMDTLAEAEERLKRLPRG